MSEPREPVGARAADAAAGGHHRQLVAPAVDAEELPKSHRHRGRRQHTDVGVEPLVLRPVVERQHIDLQARQTQQRVAAGLQQPSQEGPVGVEVMTEDQVAPNRPSSSPAAAMPGVAHCHRPTTGQGQLLPPSTRSV